MAFSHSGASEGPEIGTADRAISLLIADDHCLLVDALCMALADDAGFQITTSGTLPSTLDVLAAHKGAFDVVMLDLSMPGMSGLNSVAEVIAAAGAAAVVLFSGTEDEAFVWRAMELGAKGFISKRQNLKCFAATLRLIADGNEYIPVSLSKRTVEAQRSYKVIDDRERVILSAVAEGKTNKEIAHELGSTEVAIKMKMRAICQKLRAKNRAHAVMIARDASFI